MKIKMWVAQEVSGVATFTCEIETDDYDELKNKSLEEVQQLIEGDEVKLESGWESNVDFVLERSEEVKNKACVENKFTFFEEVKD